MVDCGSQSFSMISRSYADALRVPLLRRNVPRGIEGFNGSIDLGGLTDYTIPLMVQIGEHFELVSFDVVDTLAHYPIVFGIPWFKTHNPSIDWAANTVCFPSAFCEKSCLKQSHTIDGLPRHPDDTLALEPISGARAYEVRRRTLWKQNSKAKKQAATLAANDQPIPPPVFTSPSIPSPSPLVAPPIAIVSSAAFRLSAKDCQVFMLSYSDLERSSASSGGSEPPSDDSPLNVQSNAAHVSNPDLEWDEEEKINFKEHVPEIYQDFPEVFDKIWGDTLPRRRDNVDHKIPIQEGTKIPESRIYPLSESELESIRKYLEENLKRGFIRPSSSPVAAPILFVRKKDGSLRLCVDFRNLNSVTVKNKYPLPLIGETLDRLGKAKFFTKFDLRNGYHHIRIAAGEEWKTAFRTRYGHYEYQVMPFGLTNAPASFQNFMNDVFAPFLDRFVVVYIDDILVYSDTLEEHKIHVRQVLDKMRENGLFANAKKCSFHETQVEYLGYLVSPGGITMDPDKVASIKDWPPLRNVKDVQSFLGFANFYRRFIRNFAGVAAPLNRLTRKDVPFHMSPNALEAFEGLKLSFTTAPVLAHFTPGVQLVLETDSSDFATAAVISQKIEGLLHPIAFFSRKLTPAELNYEIHDKELLPIIESYRHWRAYLEGASDATLIYTDHKNLEFFFGSKVLTRRQSRWYETLAGQNFLMIHRAGKLQGKTDSMSRRSDYAVGQKASESEPVTFFPNPPLQAHANFADPLPTLPEELLAFQDEDTDIRPILQNLRLKENLDKLDASWTLDPEGLLRWKDCVYVPANISTRLRVVKSIHDAEEAGHRGVDRTIEKFRRTYYFPGCHNFIKNYVNTCDSCHRAKPLRSRAQGFLKPLPIPVGPWKSLSMDFIVKLPPTSRGFDSIFVVVDRFTKMAYLMPFSEKGSKAPDIARLFFAKIVGSHGLPDDIVSDRGSVFTSEFWQALQDLCRIKSNLSTAFHPQSDGQTERVNQTIEQIIRFYTNYLQDDWDDLLPIAQFAYNDAAHSSTHTSPFVATYGYSPRLDVSVPAEAKRFSNRAAETLVSRMKRIHELVKVEIGRANVRAAKYYDARKSEAQIYNIGDPVFLSARNITTKRPSKKLDSKNLGPFKILRPIGNDDVPVAYELDLPTEMKVHPVFHVSLLHAHPQNEIPGRENDPPPLTEVDGEMQSEIASILDSRTWNKRLQYRVRWIGFNSSHDEWIDSDDASNAPDLVKEFHIAYPKKPAEAPARGSSRIRGEAAQ
ncbi:putative transposase, partial [Phenoliferia sp. Uapishka_3]